MNIFKDKPLMILFTAHISGGILAGNVHQFVQFLSLWGLLGLAFFGVSLYYLHSLRKQLRDNNLILSDCVGQMDKLSKELKQ